MARRVCAQCKTKESRWPWQMFRIWKGDTHSVDLCSFSCAREWYGTPPTDQGEAGRD